MDGYSESFVGILRATMEYRNELKVHPDGKMEENKEKQVKQQGVLNRVDHEIATKSREEDVNGRRKLHCTKHKRMSLNRPESVLYKYGVNTYTYK